MSTFDEVKHPRGQAANAGQFREVTNSAPTSALSDSDSVQSAAMPEIELYESADGAVRLDVRHDGDTVWLTQSQMADLFGVDRNTVGEHLQNAHSEGEIDRGATTRRFRVVRLEGSRSVGRELEHFDLDAVLSVGYRVRSSAATQFRKWATDVLKRYVLTGSAVNQRRIEELTTLTGILARSTDENVSGLADVVSRYTQDFALLSAYDRGDFAEPVGTVPAWSMGADDARDVIREVRAQFPGDAMFGAERPGGGLAAVLDQVEQTSFGEPLYPTVEERAANLIYMIVKNHPLADGNKRSAAAIAGYYLERNGCAPLPANTLAALTLVAASSSADQRDQIIGVIQTVLASHNDD